MGVEDTAKKDILQPRNPQLGLEGKGASGSSFQGTASYLFLWDQNL